MFIAFQEVRNSHEGPSLRCIQILYGGYGLNVIKELRMNVPLSLPIILNHLKQKQEEWRMFSSGFNKLWKPVFTANHHMSLDHHNAYLHQDSKFLCTNDSLAEINGIGDRRSEDTKLEFMFSNMNIHKLRLLSTHKTILFRYLFI
ncbi:hypothetical protein Ccrd_024026 [Cynara cardunculus var. scolymus]|uniref:Uncharacterized protein n=1 Tax=Cynara cardunculus var. scolymus TaxID=59895 RepID=A0A103DZ83_CYNCS|nr:hypothetical protein Ccrd_024026 [Cynara cardunculus var. scolymus]